MAQIDDLDPLREVIRRHRLSAKKSLGQNFLLDLNLTARIARAAEPLESFTAVEIGPGPGGLTRALLRAGDVYCWGQNRYGQLGDGTTIDRATPVRVATSLPFTAIAASGAHSCGLTTGGATLCWGYNLDGQLGDGTRDNRSRPVPVRAGGTG